MAAKDILNIAGSFVEPGISTDEIDRLTHEAIVKAGIYPSPLGYMGFPKSLCSSVNEVVCHGIPDRFDDFLLGVFVLFVAPQSHLGGW